MISKRTKENTPLLTHITETEKSQVIIYSTFKFWTATNALLTHHVKLYEQ